MLNGDDKIAMNDSVNITPETIFINSLFSFIGKNNIYLKVGLKFTCESYIARFTLLFYELLVELSKTVKFKKFVLLRDTNRSDAPIVAVAFLKV